MSWILFNQSADEKLTRSLGAEPSEIQAASGDAVLCALEQPRSSVVLLPGETAGRVVLLQIKRRRTAGVEEPSDGSQPIAYRSSGFLGLNDEPIFLDDQPQPRSRWWQRKQK